MCQGLIQLVPQLPHLRSHNVTSVMTMQRLETDS